MRTLLLPAALAIGLSAAGAAVVSVNAAPPAPDAAGAPHADRVRPLSRPSERVEPRLAYIKTALKITDAQNAAFNVFADAMRKQAKAADADWDKRHAEWEQRRAGGNPPPPKSAIDRMQEMQDHLTKAAQRVGDMLAAAKPLYAVLSDDQKHIADELLGPHHWGHGEHMGRMGGHEGGHEGGPPKP